MELFRLGGGDPVKLGMRTSEVVTGFYSFLGFPRLWTDAAIRRAVKEGVEKRVFGYATGSPVLGPDQRYQIERSKVVFDRSLAEDEIDLQSGFLIAASANSSRSGCSRSSATAGGRCRFRLHCP